MLLVGDASCTVSTISPLQEQLSQSTELMSPPASHQKAQSSSAGKPLSSSARKGVMPAPAEDDAQDATGGYPQQSSPESPQSPRCTRCHRRIPTAILTRISTIPTARDTTGGADDAQDATGGYPQQSSPES